MQIGIDSFAAAYDDASLAISASDRLRNLVEQIEHADRVGLDSFGIGEHHRREYLDSALAVIIEAGKLSGHPADRLKVGVHALGYVAATKQAAADDFFPGYARAVSTVAEERGWRPPTRAAFDAHLGPEGALLIGSAEEVVDKIARHSEALGGISRITFQMNASSLPHAKLMRAIEAIGTRVAPVLHGEAKGT
jgi:alkanesulfonate monooxygenase SsuD/methylene tetrahydromethanopterin reductase-like flavin-dependent oxidoreductase (luciferase family)